MPPDRTPSLVVGPASAVLFRRLRPCCRLKRPRSAHGQTVRCPSGEGVGDSRHGEGSHRDTGHPSSGVRSAPSTSCARTARLPPTWRYVSYPSRCRRSCQPNRGPRGAGRTARRARSGHHTPGRGEVCRELSTRPMAGHDRSSLRVFGARRGWSHRGRGLHAKWGGRRRRRSVRTERPAPAGRRSAISGAGMLVSRNGFSLLGVVGQQLLEVAVEDANTGDDLAGSRCPFEGFRVAVPVLDVGVDSLDEYTK